MATTFSVFEPSHLDALKRQLWGTSLKQEVFLRWSQGFVFSKSSPTALVQHAGGPCAIIAPVQAFLVKRALFVSGNPQIGSLINVSDEQALNLLVDALAEILSKLYTDKFVVVGLEDEFSDQLCKYSKSSLQAGGLEPCVSSQAEEYDCTSFLSEESFHAKIRYFSCKDVGEMKTLLNRMLPLLQSSYGVLLFLYSVLCTKGLEQINSEVEDSSEPLIDGLHGHGSQSLINLLLTSEATSNVWDNDKEISGLKLRGIQKQPTIGFLTLLEHMRYCEVGCYYKNPQFPVWLLGSETHLTVLFSTTESLVVTESPGRNASHIFASFDPDGNGFISSSQLDDLLKALDLVSEKEYVDIMRSKLDSEELGIITRNSFMEEFFPEEPQNQQVQSFHLYHHNALPQSNAEGKVEFSEGKAKLADEIETQFISDTSPLALCLQTKWPSIEVTWSNGKTLSLN